MARVAKTDRFVDWLIEPVYQVPNDGEIIAYHVRGSGMIFKSWIDARNHLHSLLISPVWRANHLPD